MGVQQQFGQDDRALSALIGGLEIEFGHDAAAALAERFLEAEAIDFRWAARLQERWLGGYEGCDEDEDELDRVAILGLFRGRWFVATCIVDGEGTAQAMSGCRDFACVGLAETALAGAR